MKPRSANPVAAALQLQRAAARQGFDWRELAELWAKLHEEIGELRAARNQRERQEEFGDLLFMLLNLARHLGVHPARALTAANRKFMRRYAHIRRHFKTLPPLRDPRRLQAMEELWQAAKARERR
jgi:uncharacterized protein YabN with tetrapyrrole methylase and pyrophosphatase domain